MQMKKNKKEQFESRSLKETEAFTVSFLQKLCGKLSKEERELGEQDEHVKQNSKKKTAAVATVATVIAMSGDLGSGKTVFVQFCAKFFGIKETVNSPTFIIEKIYEIPRGLKFPWKKMIHIDAYRLNRAAELIHLGWNEIYNNPENIIFLEWPERVEGLIPSDAVKLNFTFIDENTRKIN
jgi:tRNA threonylcarbamoyladenosine biosynthesis protein TsaE